MIELTNICFSYGKKVILQNLSLSINQGDCIGIAGANGCGKSTLLSILAGARHADSGQIQYLLNDPDQKKSLRSNIIGYVPQENPLIPELSVKDNIKLWFRGNKQDLKKELETGFLHLLGVHEYWNKPVRKLSGGLKKRVTIGCALANRPSVLILDEPSAALDLICKEDIKNYLSIYLKNGGTILITTHEEPELDICNRLVVMKSGSLTEICSSLRGKQLIDQF